MKEEKRKVKGGKNQITLRLMLFYLCIIVCISYVACYFAWKQQRGELLADMDMTLLRVSNEYESITDDFWNIYIPIFENHDRVQLMYGYFGREDVGELMPMEKMELKALLSQMSLRDDRVRWIAVYNSDRQVNYIYFVAEDTLQLLPKDFPYMEELTQKSDTLEIYGERRGEADAAQYSTIAIAGGGLSVGGVAGRLSDAIVVGFDTSQLHRICENNQILPSVRFDITVNENEIFSSNEEAFFLKRELEPGQSGILKRDDGIYYVSVSAQTAGNVRIYYSVDYAELFWASQSSMPLILLVVAGVMIFSAVLYGVTVRSINREVAILRGGLEKIGENQLEYRIREEFKQGDFKQIADSVNAMAQSLKENIDRVYYYKLRQREAEMQELQAKFNPHFLYNSLEMFRARCYQNGDEETAELIAQTASIFRGFINPRTFIPIQEELAFSKRYLSLFKARYGDSVEILYDIDTQVLQYGIVRNVFQPLIENYFVHGIDMTREDNYLRFCGSIRDEKSILITVEDNGLGVEAEKLELLNVRLQEPISTEKESYGLKNLHQRLRLFYGDGYGITLLANEAGGMTIEMLIGCLTCEEAATMSPEL